MRTRRAVLLALLISAVGAAQAPAAPTRDCGSRIIGPEDARFASQGDAVIGPVAFSQMKRLANPRVLDRFRSGRGGYLVKTPATIRGGKVTSVSIAPRDRDVAGLTYAGSLRPGVPSVRFAPCRPRVARFTLFAGGFALTQRTCVDLVLRVRGRERPYRRTISFGMGTGRRACA